MWGLLPPRRGARGEPPRPAAGSATVPGCEELTLNEAMLLTYSGRPREALDRPRRARRPRLDPRARALRALAEVPALVATGRCETGIGRGAHARSPSTRQLPDQIAIPGPGMHILIQIYALAECGRLERGRRAGRRGLRGDARHRAARRPDVARPPAGPLRACWPAGSRPPGAGSTRRWPGARSTTSSAPAGSCCPRSPPPHACSGDAGGCRGDRGRARPAADVPVHRRPSRSSAGRGRSWRGRPPGGRRVLQAAADARRRRPATAAPRRGSSTTWSGSATRSRWPSGSASWPTECEGELVADLRRPRRPRPPSGDADALVAVADDFERLGAVLLAAEAATEAAQAFQRRGDRREAAALARPRDDAWPERARGPGHPACRTRSWSCRSRAASGTSLARRPGRSRARRSPSGCSSRCAR